MVIKRKVKKELLFIIYYVIMLIGVYLTPYGNDDSMTKIGLEFILAFPMILVEVEIINKDKVVRR